MAAEEFAKDNANLDAQTGEKTSAQGDGQNATEKRIADLEVQLKAEKDRYLYLYADFENYKKRAIKERSEATKFGWESVARDLLQVIDNLERAVLHMPKETSKTLSDGLHMILSQFKATLQKQGVQQVSAVGQSFDPNVHEAVGQENSDHPEGTVSTEHQPGYTLHGRLLRPARVVVSGGKAS